MQMLSKFMKITSNSKTQKAQEDEKLVFQKNR